MKAFWQILKRYVAPYRGYVGGSVILNILAAVFNLCSFSLLIPILRILFNMEEKTYEFVPWSWHMPFSDIANNGYYYVSKWITDAGESRVLLMLCLFFIAIVRMGTITADAPK